MTMSILWLTRRERRWRTPTVRELVRTIGVRRPRTDVPDIAVGAPIVAMSVRRRAPRPAPALRWTDGRSAPVGDLAASAIPNDRLGPSDVPPHDASWEAVADFARSYDGYAYWDNLPGLASSSVQRWTRDRALPDALDELRGCLFYEYRRWHHFGEEPSGRAAEYVGAIVDAIRALTTCLRTPTVPAVHTVAPAVHTVAPADPRMAAAGVPEASGAVAMIVTCASDAAAIRGSAGATV